MSITRRDIFKSFLPKKEPIEWQEVSFPDIESGLETYKKPWDESAVRHLLRRTQFGAPIAEVEYFKKHSAKKAVKELLDTTVNNPAPPVNNYNDDKVTDEQIPLGQTWVNATNNSGMLTGRRIRSYKSWWMMQMITQNRSIHEKMVLFWHNHFATQTETVRHPQFIYQHNLLLRKYALGNFKEMTKAITTDPAMLRYLNGALNTKKAPDENYGRELQELFTIGKGPGSHYTESDVKAAARVLTGYKIRPLMQDAAFDPQRHDDGDKQFSAFYGNAIIRGRSGKDGQQELDDLLNMIFDQQEVAKFICRKLYVFFVYSNITPAVEQHIISPLAEIFRKHDYEIKPVLEKLLTSKHFFDMANRGAIIKSPVEFIANLCREYNISFPAEQNYLSRYDAFEFMFLRSAYMQQNIGDPPNVAGWQAYYESPAFYKLWVNSDTLPKRNQFSDRMVLFGYKTKSQGDLICIDLIAFAKSLPSPENPDMLIQGSVQYLLGTSLPADQQQFIKTSILLSNLQDMADHYWTNIWTSYIQNPADENKTIVVTKLRQLYKYLMDLPEYQLC
jgi:uncharacterized protein (DUF1800 family)